MKCAIALLVLVMLSATACEKGSAERRSSATLAEQKMCSEQAAKADQKQIALNGEPTLGKHFYTSHYNSSANICYVMFLEDRSYQNPANAEVTTRIAIDIADAFEGRDYGSFEQINEQVTRCRVGPFGLEKVTEATPNNPFAKPNDNCHSREEFRALAFKLYGIAQ